MLTVSNPDGSTVTVPPPLVVAGVFRCRVVMVTLTASVVFFLDSLFQVLHETFPQHTFLMNGLVQGVKVRPVDADDQLPPSSQISAVPLDD